MRTMQVLLICFALTMIDSHYCHSKNFLNESTEGFPKFSLTIENEELATVCQRISTITGYEIKIANDGNYSIQSINLQGVGLIDGLKSILATYNYALQVNESKIIKIFILDNSVANESTVGDQKVVANSMTEDRTLNIEIFDMKTIENVRSQNKVTNDRIIVDQDSENGIITMQDVELVKKHAKMDNPSSVVFDDDEGTTFTLADIKKIKNTQAEEGPENILVDSDENITMADVIEVQKKSQHSTISVIYNFN